MNIRTVVNMRHVNSFCLAMGYGLFFYTLQVILYYLHIVDALPGAGNLVAWDANWYQDMVKYGTRYWAETNSSAGFFPLFPFFWKVLSLNGATASLFNLVCFSIGFAIFNTLYHVPWKMKMVWLTIPSLYFSWVPYTEALFILFVALTFLGIVRNNRWVIWIGLFLLSLTRPTTIVFLPSLFVMQLVSESKSNWLKASTNFLVLYAMPLLVGLILFIVYQYQATGVWFAYFKLQSTAWGHKFAWPVLPFGSMFGLRHLWLNAIALFICFLGLCWVINTCVKWLFEDVRQPDKIYTLSSMYLFGILFTDIFFNPLWGINATNIFDAHRHVFASPCFWVVLYKIVMIRNYKLKHYIAMFFLMNVFWLLFGSYTGIDMLLYFNLAGLYVLTHMLLTCRSMRWLPLIIISINIGIQVWLFQGFISGVYPG